MKRLMIVLLLCFSFGSCSKKQSELTCVLTSNGTTYTYIYYGEKPVEKFSMSLDLAAANYEATKENFPAIKKQLIAEVQEIFPGVEVEAELKDDVIHITAGGQINKIDMSAAGSVFDWKTITHQEIKDVMVKNGGSCTP
ncbi:MAG: hypothetical protein LBR25_04780 [Erysipelotrichaceae bacterium]|nr:hypothetical protein [Erysipelotrichaceae bacterium]